MNRSRSSLIHDKTSYNVNATTPSSQSTSPTLTQSTSESNSTSTPSTSPNHLRTPPRYGRSQTRCPDLGRVPLHRRGNSKTYEHLEDLLREAGYKDTRVFTPEGEHREESADERYGLKDDVDKRSSIRGGVDAVVGFLAGFMPSATSRSSSLRRHDSYDAQSTTEPSSPSPARPYSPSSPLAHRNANEQKPRPRTPLSSEPHSPTMMTSSIESLEHTPRPKHKSPPRTTTHVPPNMVHSHSQPTHNVYRPPQHQLVHRISDQTTYTFQRPHLDSQTSRTSSRQHSMAPAAGMSRIAQPCPSRAGAYLRHMTSQPDIPKRPNSTPAQPPRRTFLLNDSDSDITRAAYNENDAQPPLPRTWLENVARAVLFGGMGAYFGGPSAPSIVEPACKSLGKTLRPTRSSISQVSPKYLRPQQSRGGLSDRTNTRSVASANCLAPPELFTRIERGRARKSLGEVTRTRVVCRSAPVSRAVSPTRNRGGGCDGEGRRAKRIRAGKEREPTRRGRHDEKNRLPSLASTKTEGDAWNRKPLAPIGGNRYLSGWGMNPNSDDDGDEELRSSSEDDGELNLAQMLVPPKRQNSIKSLRKHLDGSSNLATGSTKGVSRVRGVPLGAGGRSRSQTVRQSIEEDGWDGSDAEDWGRGWVRKGSRRKNSGDEDEDVVYPGFLVDGRGSRLKSGVMGSERSATGKRRVGLPAPWGSNGGGL